jgi:hypothetical protein
VKRYTVTLVARRQVRVRASSVAAAEAVALTETESVWPDLDWLISDTEEEA